MLFLCALTKVVNLIYGAALVVSAEVILEEFNWSDHYFSVLQTTAAVVTIITFFFVPKFANRFGLSSLGGQFCAMIPAGVVMAPSVNYAKYLIGYAILMAL